MASISDLGNLQPVEPLDLDAYVDRQETQANLPPAGEFTLQAPDSFPSETFGRSITSGALTAKVNPKILGGPAEGKIVYCTVSAKQYKRGGVVASQIGDYLRACGFRGKLKDEQEQADAIETTTNRVYKAELDWEAYHRATGFRLQGMERFPSDGNGGHQPFVEHPTELRMDEFGNPILGKDGKPQPLRLWARFYVKRFIPAQAE